MRTKRPLNGAMPERRYKTAMIPVLHVYNTSNIGRLLCKSLSLRAGIALFGAAAGTRGSGTALDGIFDVGNEGA